MAIDWGLAAQPQNTVTQALQAFGLGQQLKAQQMQRQREEQTYQRKEGLRENLIAAYNPNTGAIDPSRARQAYVGAGDIEGAMSFDAGQRKQQADSLKAFHEMHSGIIQMLGGVNDQNSYNVAKARAAQMYGQFGMDIAAFGLPEAYDPAVVRGLQMQALETDKQLQAQLAERRFQADQTYHERDDARADRVANNSIGVSNARLGLAREARGEGRVRFKERALDRQALAASGGIRTDTSDLDY